MLSLRAFSQCFTEQRPPPEIIRSLFLSQLTLIKFKGSERLLMQTKQ